MKQRAWFAIIVGYVIALSPELRAENQAAAEALFAAGRAAVKAGDMAGACEKFRESQRLDAALGTRLNLAVCEAKLGRLAVAWQLFQSLAKALPAEDPRVELVRDHLKELEPRLPRVTLIAEGTLPSGLTVRIGGVRITESGFGVPIPLDPGRHRVEIDAPGFITRHGVVTLDEGGSLTLGVQPLLPGPVPAPVDGGASTPSAHRSDTAASVRRTSGIIVLGVAGAALTTSLATGLAVLDRKQTKDAECDVGGCSQAGIDAAEQGKTLATISTASFLACAALAGAGVVLLVFDGAPDSKSTSPSLGLELSALGIGVRANL